MRQSRIAVALVAFVCAGAAFGGDKKIISPPGAKPGGNRSYFKDAGPTRTTVVVAVLVGPGNIEITATAKK
ncbi:MAG TPA: hypothetical protein VK789_00965 [Bryobacteraceae bacterium]|jgi:hypothetical protein|nr:hypothetical protein [Bryobacteraceae bacterium]